MNFTQKEFGNRLTLVLKIYECSDKELAEHLNVSPKTIADYRRGIRKPPADSLAAICNYFPNLSGDYLLCRTNNMTDKMNVKSICNETGLSEQAVSNLSRLCKTTIGTVKGNKVLNDILNDNDFEKLFVSLLSYIDKTNHFVSIVIDAINKNDEEVFFDIKSFDLVEDKAMQLKRAFFKGFSKFKNKKINLAKEYFLDYNPIYCKKALTNDDQKRADSLLRQLKEE